MEERNWSESSVKVVSEILPGNCESVLREITLEDIDSVLFSPDTQFGDDSLLLPYPVIDPAADYFDREWTQSVIKISYQPENWSDEL